MRLLTHPSSLYEEGGGFFQSQGLTLDFSGLFLFTDMMLRYAIFILQIICGCNGCFPTRTKLLTDSYIPVAIQILHHYKAQLQEYLPYSHTALCEFQKKGTTSALPILSKDVCVDQSLRRINLFLIDLQREAVRQNLEEFQGFDRVVLAEVRKTSHLTSVQQFHFVIRKLQEEGTGNAVLQCKIVEFLHDLGDGNSKLYRNLINIKPLNYLN